MPIRVHTSAAATPQEDGGISGDVRFEYCSPECLLRNPPAERRIVQVGQTETTRCGMLAEGRLYVSIAGKAREAGHVLGSQRNTLEARARWSKLLGAQAPGLMRVEACCDCTARVELIQGAPLVDANTTPFWLKKMVGSQQALTHAQPVPFARWAGWMASLAEGLDCLSQRGLAHGDPFPFNVLVTGERAAWVDYSHLSDDPEQQAKDLWAFLFFTVLYSLAFCEEWSPGLERRLVELYSQEDWSGLAGSLRAVFAEPWSDLQPAPSHDALVGQFMGGLIERGFMKRTDPASLAGAAILAKSSPLYFSSFLEWIRIGSDARTRQELERVRHLLIEAEHMRLRVPRAELEAVKDQLQLKREEVRELLAKHDWLVEDRKRRLEERTQLLEERMQLLAELERKHAEISQIFASVQWLSEENSRLAKVAEKANEEYRALHAHAETLNRLLEERDQEIQRIQEQAEALRQELRLYYDRKDGYYKAVQARMDLLVGMVEPLLGNLEAFRVSKTYKMGVLASTLRNLPLGGKVSTLSRFIKRIALGGDKAPLALPENEIIQTIDQLASQMRIDINAVRSLQITRPHLPPPAPPAAPRPAENAVAAPAAPAAPSAPEGPALAIQPLVSVLLPVYNHADMLGGAVESVRQQTYARWEIVILDDGSKDNIDEVLERYKDDPRIRIHRQPNQKLPNALTNLHQLARGEFITWTSADNLLAPTMLERLVETIAQDPETIMVYADTALIDEAGEPLVGEGYRDHNRDQANPALMRLTQYVEAVGEEPDNFINACFLYRAQAARAVGAYAPDLNALEDYDFFLRLRRAGRCRHVGNAEPLYFYRVHRRTLSEEVLTTQLQAHTQRAQTLIDYDKARGRWFGQRWNVTLSPRLDPKERQRLRDLLERMPVNIVGDSPAIPQAEPLKRVFFAAPGEPLPQEGAVVVCGPAEYALLHVRGGAAREIGRTPLGQDISPLALKSRRQVNPATYYEFVKAQDRPILGAHLSFADVDAPQTIELIKAHPDLFFALIDDERRGDPAKGQAIAAACDNCVYLGPRLFGACYWGYADFAAIFCPPLAGAHPGRAVRQAHQLAMACGRWLIHPALAGQGETLPFAAPYLAGDPLPQAWLCERPLSRPQLLDDYLKQGSEAGSLQQALRLLGAALQEAFIPRPDFGQMHPLKETPRPWRPEADGQLRKGWIGLWIDTLDRGGLEEILALLAEEMRQRGMQVRILCSERGGLVAERLTAQGFPCEVFGQDAARFEAYLRQDPPLLLSTHFTQQMLDVPARLGIPLVETIHNMYVHFDEAMWEAERRRIAKFTHAIAVSRLVREYYLHWHGAMPGERVTVVNNAADHLRTLGLERRYARQMLGLDEQTCAFLNLASFDGRKNQIGLVTAFEQLHLERPETTLLMVGNIASPYYYDLLLKRLEESRCREAIRLMDFQKDMARVLAAADVSVLPSYFEGWSVSATEACCAGLPVIHTNCGSGPELCENGGGHLVSNPGGDPIMLNALQLYRDCQNPEPPNTSELVGAMRLACDDLARWRASRSQLRTEAVARYSVRKMVNEYLAIFARAIREGARQRD